MRITFERRRSDFERDARVTPFTGSCCCCCCCLHWVGALAGGAIGMRSGWIAAEKQLGAPLPTEGNGALNKGLAIGIIASVGLLFGAIASAMGGGFGHGGSEVYLILLAFAPPLAIVPVSVPLLVSAYRTRRRMLGIFRDDAAKLPPKDGSDKSMSLYRAKLTPAPKTHTGLVQFSVFCRHCWTDLGESMHLDTCPECGNLIGDPMISGPDYGVSVAWRASLTSFGMATGGTLIGYVLMAAIAAVISR
jgi:hypothetical protein